MDPASDLSHAIDSYLEAIPPSSRLAPGPPADPAAVESALDDIARAIAPLQLPGEIAWLWRSWQAERFSPLPYPHLTDPAFALDSWVQNAVEMGEPRILFPIAYESHGFLLVELGGPADVAAPVWKYQYAGDEYVLAYPSLASLFRSCAEAAEVAGVRPPDDDNERHATYLDVLDGAAFDAIVDRHMSASIHCERDRRVPDLEVRRWPKPWQQAQGVTDESFKLLGATHTVQQFVTEARAGAVVGRIVGRFRVRGGGWEELVGALSDGTGSILVLLSVSVLNAGGRVSRGVVEVELEAFGPISDEALPDTRPIQGAALRGDVATASAAGGAWGHAQFDAARRMPVIRRIVPAE